MDTKRIFFALWPDHRQREQLRETINAVAKTVEGRYVDRRDWHVTLAFIGDFPEDRIDGLLERAGDIEVEPFRLTFDRLEFWARPRVASLTAAMVPDELEDLVVSLNAVLIAEGIAPENRAYRPHITVVRNARTFTTERLAQRLTTEWSGFELVETVSEHGRSFYRPVKQ